MQSPFFTKYKGKLFAPAVAIFLLPLIFIASVATNLYAQDQPLAEPCVDYVSKKDKKNPRLLIMRGVACFEQKKYAKALLFYQQADKIHSEPLLDAAMGRAFDELGLLDHALVHYEKYLQNSFTEEPEDRQRIKQRLDALQKQAAANVQINVWPTGATIWLELPNAQREFVGQAPMLVKLRPGTYQIIVEHDGYYRQTRQVSVSSGDEKIEFDLISQDALWNVSGREWQRTGLWTMATGTASVLTGAILYYTGDSTLQQARDPLFAGSEENTLERRQELLNSGYLQQNFGTGFLIFGGAALITGATFWTAGKLSDKPQKNMPSDPKNKADLSTILSPNYVGIKLHF